MTITNNSKRLQHLDLFSGIGGFAYAIDQVWDNVEHTFCDSDDFCRQVLKKHWPESEIYHDIRKIDTNTLNKGLERLKQSEAKGQRRQPGRDWQDQARPFILTGGFPCQPFSAAGLRRGTSDDRYLWPEMLRVIRLAQPEWVIAENVGGLLTLQDGVVFEQVCADLETAGYEVQPFVIPAVAVNAPHRRDRIWFIGHSKHHGRNSSQNSKSDKAGNGSDTKGSKQVRKSKRADTLRFDPKEWERDWLEVATWSSRMDDGVSNRVHRIKALGNSIVPQVAIEICKAIKGVI